MSDREDQCRAAPDQVDEPCAEALSRGGLSFDSAMAPGGRTARRMYLLGTRERRLPFRRSR